MKHLVIMGQLMAFVFSLLSHATSYAQCTMACNDLVQVSIPSEGFAVVDADMILEGDSTSCPGPKTVIVELPNGVEIGDTVTCDYADEVLDAMVIDNVSGNFCWGTILIKDKLKPVIDCQDTTVNCTADLSPNAIGLVSVTDNCDPDPIVNMVENISPEACSTPFTQTITRTWHAIDESGNIALPCVQTISVVRPSLADVEFPPNFDNVDTLALSCENPDTNVAKTGFPMVDGIPINELCKISAIYQDQVIFSCANEYSVFRKWEILDCCSGEILAHTQHIKIMDVDGPVLDCPATLTVSANGPDCDGYFLLPSVEAEDNCSAVVDFQTLIPGHFGQATNGGIVNALPLGTYILTYEATDACDNQSTCEVTLTVADDVAPTAVCDEITTVSLGSNGLASISAEVFDDGSHDACCGIEILAKRMDEPSAPFTPNVVFDCEDIGETVMVTVQVSDCEGNANTCMVEVNPDDKTPPQLICPPNVTLECTEWLPAPTTLTGEPTVIENCEIDTLFFEDFENLDVCRTGTITRTFTVVDGVGLSGECSQTITLIDTTEVHYFFPPDTVVDCSQPLDSISAGEVYSTADCELVGLNFEDETFHIDCGLKIYRTYTFLNWCSGFDTSHTQLITVIDTNPPIWDTDFGALDRTFGCPGDLVKPPLPKAFDYCSPAGDTLPTMVISDVTDTLECLNRRIRTITLGAVDSCGNEAQPFVIVLTVNDTLAPLPFIPDADLVQCVADIPPFNPIDIPAQDDCFGPVTIDLVDTAYDTTGCSGSIIRTYLLTDVCGQDTLATHTFPYSDTIPPSAIDTLLGPVPCFSDIPSPLLVTFPGIDNCGGGVTSEFLSDVVIDSTACGGEVRRRWLLTDDCGNSQVVDQTILVMDTLAPTVTCSAEINVNVLDTMTCERALILFAGVDDNCETSLILSNNLTGFEDTLFYSFPVGTTEVVFYAEDECGNLDSCQTTVNILDPNGSCMGRPMVMGRVEMHTGEAMTAVEMHMEDASNFVLSQTDGSGDFMFENIQTGASCLLQPFKNDDPMNGVSTFDILLITKHILGEQPFTSPFEFIASDVNNSGAISTFDILELRKMVLQISDEFPNNTSWRFIPAEYVFPDPADPFSEPFPESIWLAYLTEDALDQDFIGVKIGDVNGSAQANFAGGGNLAEGRSEGEFGLSANDMVLEKGATVRVPIFAEGEEEIAALQATIDFDFEKMKFRGIEPGVMRVGEREHAVVEAGLVTLSWFETEPIEVQAGDELFYLEFEALEKTELANALLINSMKTPAIAFQDGGNPLNISWRIHAAPTVPVDDAHLFELAQNRPNPFVDETVVSFRVEERMPVRMEIIDLAGRSQVVMEREVSEGWHEVKLDAERFYGNGVYICRLVTPHGAAQKRMIRQ